MVMAAVAATMTAAAAAAAAAATAMETVAATVGLEEPRGGIGAVAVALVDCNLALVVLLVDRQVHLVLFEDRHRVHRVRRRDVGAQLGLQLALGVQRSRLARRGGGGARHHRRCRDGRR